MYFVTFIILINILIVLAGLPDLHIRPDGPDLHQVPAQLDHMGCAWRNQVNDNLLLLFF